MGRLGGLAVGVLLGALAGAFYLAVLSGSPGALILAYLAQLPLFAAGLWLGVGAAAAAGITASTALLAAGGPLAASLFAALYAAPVVLLTRQALLARSASDGTLEWYPPGLLTAWLTGFGLVALAGAVLLLGGPNGVEALLRGTLAPAVDHFVAQSGTSGSALTELLAMIIPGAIAASWMTMTASNAVLAQGVLARFGAAWRPSPDLAALTLPVWLSGLLVVAAAAAAFGGVARFCGVNVLIVLSVPFCLAGLAVVHVAARRLARPQMALVAFYVLAGLLGWPLLVAAILGALDAPLGLRRRFALPGSIGGRIDD
jgi:hypothetical protein